MKNILKILTLILLFSNLALAETQEEKRARYVLVNMQHDYIKCYSFYKIGAEYVRKSNGDPEIIIGIEKSSDNSLKLVNDTGEMIGMSSDEMSKMVKSEMTNQLDQIGNDFNNASILIEKYSQLCEKLTEDKKQRISFWEKKAINKFK